MPELPEAETIARHLNARLSGARIRAVEVLRSDIVHGDPAPLEDLLRHRSIRRVRRRAKRIVFDLDPPAELIVRLGMSGRLLLMNPTAPLDAHTHLRIGFDDLGEALLFRDPRRFGGVWCFAGQGRPVGRPLGELGLEPLETNLADFRRAIHRRRQLKPLLMDQRVIAGLGNIYCDESLHAAMLHPRRTGDSLSLDEVTRLRRAIRGVLRRAIRFNGSTFLDYRSPDGARGEFQNYLRVYQKEGKPCRRCGAAIERMAMGGRSTFFCPFCQAISHSVPSFARERRR